VILAPASAGCNRLFAPALRARDDGTVESSRVKDSGASVPPLVALLTTSLRTEGPATMLVELALRLDRRRYRPLMLQLEGNTDAPLARRLAAAGVETGSVGGRGASAILRLAHLLRRHRPVLLHTRLIRADFLGRLAGSATGVPVLTNLCDIYSRHFADLHGRLRGGLFARLDRATLPLATRIVANGQGIREDLLEHGIRVARAVRVIPNGVDTERYRRSEAVRGQVRQALGIPDDAWVVGTVGRLWHQKRQDVLIAAVPRLVARCPGVRVLIVGDGERRAALEAHADGLGIARHVHLLGRRSDVPALLAAMDVFAFPSEPEGCPNAVLEAMSSALPVVGADVAGTRELVVEADTGRLVPADDPGALADALLTFADRARAREAGQRARARVEAHYTLALMAARFQAMYDEILTGASR
jgi:glycosyltransferase involved in cell wall biosynthesis